MGSNIVWFAGLVAEQVMREHNLWIGASVTNGVIRGHLVGVTQSGLLARVLVNPGKIDGKPVPLDERKTQIVELRSLRTGRGRPMAMNIFGVLRSDVEKLIVEDEGYARAAMDFLFGEQTTEERAMLATKYDNDRGFRKNHAKLGAELSEKSVWSPEDRGSANNLLMWYTGSQLLDWEVNRRAANPLP